MLKLSDDNVEPTSILWTLNKEVQTLLTLKVALQHGENIHQLFKQHKIWKNQQAPIQAALDRLPLKQLQQIIQLLADFDSAYKRSAMIAPYQALAHIVLTFCMPVNFAMPFQYEVE